MIQHKIWGIHAGKYGEADKLFSKEKIVALGWSDLGNLTRFKDRDEIKAALAVSYPTQKAQAYAVNAGQLYRFIYAMKIGDYVVYPAKHSREVRFGRVVGDYEYRPEVSKEYPNQRRVEWLKSQPRTRLSQGALYEMGSAMSFFEIDSFAEEIIAIIEGQPQLTPPAEDEGTIAAVTADIEEQTRDFVLKSMAQNLKGHPMAEFVAHLLQAMGYKTRISAPGPDRGIDVIAHPDDLGFQSPLIKVQVKSSDEALTEATVSQLYGKVGTNEFGLIVTLGTYNANAKSFAASKSNLRLIDGQELVNLVFQYYEQLDARYKGIIPLKKVYVPEALEQEE